MVTLVLAWNQDCDRNMAFGFVIVKFALFIKQKSIVLGEGHNAVVVPARGYSAIIGIALVALGARSRSSGTRKSKDNCMKVLSSLPHAFSIPYVAMILVGALLVIYLVPSI